MSKDNGYQDGASGKKEVMNDLDPTVHQPTRLRILMLLSGVGNALLRLTE